tara:strand:- start:7386 stop:7691 length:306 start_codon:yes stop_codon:yes gene_type:complete
MHVIAAKPTGSLHLSDGYSLAGFVVEEADAVPLESTHDIMNGPLDQLTIATLKPAHGGTPNAAVRRCFFQRPSKQRPCSPELSCANRLDYLRGRFHLGIVA